ncbi:MAG: Ig-like domain-containing protein, partial [Thermoplasmata archaeon]|nr:Ig-like domain-containing protein [Thermoplasmata archaeon]
VVGATISSAATVTDSYDGTATSGIAGGEWSLGAPTAPVWYVVPIQSLIFTGSPINGSTSVSVNLSAAAITFSSAMNESVTFGHVSASPDVLASGTWNGVGQTLTLRLVTPLAYATLYTITVRAGARTLSGIPLAANYFFSFATEPAPLVIPALLSTSPSDGATNVSVAANVSVTFDVAMNPSLPSTAISLTAAGTSATVIGSSYVEGDRLVFVPASHLSYHATYTVVVSTKASSAAGVPLPSPIVFSFRTANASRAPPPPGGGSSESAPSPIPWALLGALSAVVLVGAIALLALRGRRVRPPPPPAAPPTSYAPPPLWSEDELPR